MTALPPTRPTIINAYRERPITRPGQVERVLCKFGIGRNRGTAISDNWLERLTDDQKSEFQKRCDNAVPVGFIPTAEQMKATEGRMYHDTTEWPTDYVSTVRVQQYSDGSQIELEIWLDNGALAPQLISELRMCGFVAGISHWPTAKAASRFSLFSKAPEISPNQTVGSPRVEWCRAITKWWTRWPQANIGLACMPTGVAVIDSDVKGGGHRRRSRSCASLVCDFRRRSSDMSGIGGKAEMRDLRLK